MKWHRWNERRHAERSRVVPRLGPPTEGAGPAALSTMRALTGWIAGHPVLAFLLFFAMFPFLVPYKALATQVLIYGLFAVGFNLLYGYTGLLSFGHAAYFGLGAYGAGIALAKLGVGSVWGGLGLGLGAA